MRRIASYADLADECAAAVQEARELSHIDRGNIATNGQKQADQTQDGYERKVAFCVLEVSSEIPVIQDSQKAGICPDSGDT